MYRRYINNFSRKGKKKIRRGGTNINIAGDLLGYRISLTTIGGEEVKPTDGEE